MTNGQSMREDPEIRKGVLASIIASILVLIFIQPVLRLVWALVLGLGGKFLDKYIDSIYRSSAFGHRNHVDVMLLLFLFAASSGLFMGFTSVITHRIIDSRSVPAHPKKRNLMLMSVLMLVGTPIFLVASLSVSIRSLADLQYNTSFQQRLKVLAPKITDAQFKELEADWASMKSRQDYLSIKVRMEAIAQENRITLPEVLLR